MANQTTTICFECKDQIHTRMCPNCLSESIEEWIDVKKDEKDFRKLKKLSFYLEDFKENNASSLTDGILCKACNSHKTELCPACFAFIVYGKMESLNINPEIRSEFEQIFWFNGEFES